MSESVRKQKSGDQLTVGDWLAPDQLTDLAAEVLFTISYPGVGGTHVQVVLRQQGMTVPSTDVVAGTHLLDLASEEDLAELREDADRVAVIADIRALADWLEANPWVPAPYAVDASEHLDSRHIGGPRTEAALAKLRQVADRLGVKADERLSDRTKIEVAFGRTRYQLLAWHPNGRPAEPDPTGLNYGRGDEQQDPQLSAAELHCPGVLAFGDTARSACGTDVPHNPHTLGGVVVHGPIVDAGALTAHQQVRHGAEDGRAGAVESTGWRDDATGLVSGGLVVDDKPAGVEERERARHWPGSPLVHMGYAAGGTVCGVPGEDRVSFVWRDVTCRSCIDAMPAGAE